MTYVDNLVHFNVTQKFQLIFLKFKINFEFSTFEINVLF